MNVDRTPLKHDRGFFFVGRVIPIKPLKDTVDQALKTKVDKLTTASADERILLLEKDIPIFDNGEVGELLEQLLPEFPKLAEIDEVWIANTVSLESEGYLPSTSRGHSVKSLHPITHATRWRNFQAPTNLSR